MSNFIAYRATNTVNAKAYIGITSRSLARRWSEHCGDSQRRPRTPLHYAIRKYGPDAFLVECIGEYPSFVALKEAERRLISEQKTATPRGYNATEGGDGVLGHVFGAETLAKRSAGLRGQKRTPEQCARIGASKRGCHHSSETKAKISAELKGRYLGPPMDAAMRARLSAALKGRKRSPEAAAASAAGHRGKKRPPLTEQARANMSTAQWVPVRFGGIEYPSFAACANANVVTMDVVKYWVRSGKAERLPRAKTGRSRNSTRGIE